MKEFEHEFYGATLIGRIPKTTEPEIPVSFVDKETSTAWSKVYRYDSTVGILDCDSEKLSDMTDLYQKRADKGANFMMLILNSLVNLIGMVESVIKSFLGMFFGFGVIGFLIVFTLLLVSFMVSVYVFIIVAPLLLVIAILKWKIKKKRKSEHMLLQACVMSQFSS